ncbi:ABC transporter substrate-binding protein [Vibrio sp. UCD-FRSSP16_10]|uniref:transporter substrate-binding domain-containing protein n=1 Tax=unclassified Vibrio TaxID=2614977 RepID=UPI0007FE780C|nr:MULTISPECIES: transporter substrate-binding domain-containing protein [unclassified Vibrio]OBT14759.1 ABC transporter substrate-binding protein [Vibrio sp. UCD-FRSSP16_30]OBT20048.1 ABC transporter substrate-binding protein [Vibrio sp. UCD-FRSSP16_10]
MNKITNMKTLSTILTGLCIAFLFSVKSSYAYDLKEVKEAGVIRHIGIPYANFINYINKDGLYSAQGLDVELIQGFAKYIGVDYEFVPSNWNTAFGQLTGKEAIFTDNKIQYGNEVPITGDVISNGATILPWREQLVDFSDDYFPSAVWLISRTDSKLKPITPSGSVNKDINLVKQLIKGHNVLAMEQTCLDPNLYNLYETGANIILPKEERKLNEMVPAILNNDADNTLLDVPDTLIALEKWPGEIKVIGPVSEEQFMAAGFRKDSPELRKAFNHYLQDIRNDGTYNQLIEKYYPSVFYFYSDYFKGHEAEEI